MDGQSQRIALVWRGDAEARGRGMAEEGRFGAVFAALRAAGLTPEPCIYDEGLEEPVRAQLLGCAAALVWVNPLQGGVTRRARLDALLREVAEAGVLVSAHPDAIDSMGVKAVLWRTRALGWSGDPQLYETTQAFAADFPRRLATGPRVLKQNRGNDGVGVWKVESLARGRAVVQEAAAGAPPRETPLERFIAERVAAFSDGDGYVDQAWQPRLPEGMIRCYMSGHRLAGFGHHLVRALAPPDAGPGGPRLYSGPDDPRFQRLRRLVEEAWTPGLCRILDLSPSDLPVIWDADFLLGPRDDLGADTYVLCEINVSSVFPIPEEAPMEIARTLAERLARGRAC